jgi:hypothetical protein
VTRSTGARGERGPIRQKDIDRLSRGFDRGDAGRTIAPTRRSRVAGRSRARLAGASRSARCSCSGAQRASRRPGSGLTGSTGQRDERLPRRPRLLDRTRVRWERADDEAVAGVNRAMLSKSEGALRRPRSLAPRATRSRRSTVRPAYHAQRRLIRQPTPRVRRTAWRYATPPRDSSPGCPLNDAVKRSDEAPNHPEASG